MPNNKTAFARKQTRTYDAYVRQQIVTADYSGLRRLGVSKQNSHSFCRGVAISLAC